MLAGVMERESWLFEALPRAMYSVWSRISFVNAQNSEILDPQFFSSTVGSLMFAFIFSIPSVLVAGDREPVATTEPH